MSATDTLFDLRCHCTGDAEGHAPGGDACTELIKPVHSSWPRTNAEPAAIYAELARVAPAPERAKWKGVAALHRAIAGVNKEIARKDRESHKALLVERRGAYWALVHVSGLLLFHTLNTRSAADRCRYNAVDTEIAWWREDLPAADAAKRWAIDLANGDPGRGLQLGPWARKDGRRWVLADAPPAVVTAEVAGGVL